MKKIRNYMKKIFAVMVVFAVLFTDPQMENLAQSNADRAGTTEPVSAATTEVETTEAVPADTNTTENEIVESGTTESATTEEVGDTPASVSQQNMETTTEDAENMDSQDVAVFSAKYDDQIAYGDADGSTYCVKTDYKFNLKIPIKWSEKTSTYRKNVKSLKVTVYGGNQNGTDEYIVQAETDLKDLDVSGKTPYLSVTGLPVYITQESIPTADGGNGELQTPDGFYKVKVEAPNGYETVYADPSKQNTAFNVNKDVNSAIWYEVSTPTVTEKLDALVDKTFTIKWNDNKNLAKERPGYKKNADGQYVLDESAACSLVTLCYRFEGDDESEAKKVADDPELFIDGMSTVPSVKEDADGNWNLSFDNLSQTANGKKVIYSIRLEDGLYNTLSGDGSYGAKDDKHTTDTAITLTYQKVFAGKFIWNDGDSATTFRPSEVHLKLYKSNQADEAAETVSDSHIQWTEKNAKEWDFAIKGLDTYDQNGDQIVYSVKTETPTITLEDAAHTYIISYNNAPISTEVTKCLADGTIYATLNADLSEYTVNIAWLDGESDKDPEAVAARKEVIANGATLYLWRYTKKDNYGTKDGAPVLVNGNQLRYPLTEENSVTSSISFADFTKVSLPKYNEQGYEYVYYVTESLNDTAYRLIYKNTDSEAGVTNAACNKGTLNHILNKKVRFKATKTWQTTNSADYNNASVTLQLQRRTQGENDFVPVAGLKDLTLSGFGGTTYTQSGMFDEVDVYDDAGRKYEYRIVETKIQSGDTTVSIDAGNHFTLNGTEYEVITPEWDANSDRYEMSVYNRMVTMLNLEVKVNWNGKFSDWNQFTSTDTEGTQTIKGTWDKIVDTEIVIYQNDRPYMVLQTSGNSENIRNTDVNEDFEKTVTVRYLDAAYYADHAYDSSDVHYADNKSETKNVTFTFPALDVVDTGSPIVWKLGGIEVPALDENGLPYNYKVAETNVSQTSVGEQTTLPATYYTLYDYSVSGNKLTATVNNHVTTKNDTEYSYVSVTKKWIDNDMTAYRKPVVATLVKVNKDGSYQLLVGDKTNIQYVTADEFEQSYKTDDLTYKVTLNEGNKWFGYISFRAKDLDQWAVVEIIDGKVVKPQAADLSAWQAATVKADIAAKTESAQTTPSYTVSITGGTTCLNAHDYVITNQVTGNRTFEIKKVWNDNSNSGGTRKQKLRIKLLQETSDGKQTTVYYQDYATPTGNDNIYTITMPGNATYCIRTAESGVTTPELVTTIPEFDANGNKYRYSVEEYLVETDETGKETETAVNNYDTPETTKSGYVLQKQDKTATSYTASEGIYTEQTSYELENALVGIRRDSVKFYTIWHDKAYFQSGKRTDVNYTLYYCLGDPATSEIKEYSGDSSLPSYTLTVDPVEAGGDNPYYTQVSVSGLPTGTYDGGEYKTYHYFLAETFTGESAQYKTTYYTGDVKNEETTVAADGKYHFWEIGSGAVESSYQSGNVKLIPEGGTFKNSLQERIKIQQNKLWVGVNGVPSSKLPQANIYLWRESEYDKEHQYDAEHPDITKNVNYKDESSLEAKGAVHLNESRTGFAFTEADGTDKYFDKYDKYGAVYTYSITEQIVVADGKYETPMPGYIMQEQISGLKVTNSYRTDDAHNKRSITVRKKWDYTNLKDTAILDAKMLDQKPYARFQLYQMEIEEATTDFTDASIDFTKEPYKKYAEYTLAQVQSKAKAYGTVQTTTLSEDIKAGQTYDSEAVTWNDLPVFAPSGNKYIYYVEELTNQTLVSYDITNDAGGNTAGNRKIASGVASDTNNRMILVSNAGLNQGDAENPANSNDETTFTNTYKADGITKLTGKKRWVDETEFSENSRTTPDNPGMLLKIQATANAQASGNNKNTFTIDTSDSSYANYISVKWSQDSSDANIWNYEITLNSGKNLPIYAPNGCAYTYTVQESYDDTSDAGKKLASNYKITTGSVAMAATSAKSDTSTGTKVLDFSSKPLVNTLMGKIEVSKIWKDYNNEYGLRSNVIVGVLQYRVKDASDRNWKTYEGSAVTQGNQGKIANGIQLKYSTTPENNWKKTISNLPIYYYDGATQNAYEYRFVEVYLVDNKVEESISLDPNTGEITTSGTPNQDGSYTIPASALNGNHVILEPAPSVLTSTATTKFVVQNSLDAASTTKITIVKNWNDSSISTTSVRPDSIRFQIESRYMDGDSYSEWEPVVPTSEEYQGQKTTVTVTKDAQDSDNSDVWKMEYANLPKMGKNAAGQSVQLQYRAVELCTNLGRYAGYTAGAAENETVMKGQPDAQENPDKAVGVTEYAFNNNQTTLTNNLVTRKLHVSKKWNDTAVHTEDVTIALYSRNFVNNNADNSLEIVPGTEQTLTSAEKYEKTYTLPKYNTEGKEILYYIKEEKVAGKVYADSGYDLDVYTSADQNNYVLQSQETEKNVETGIAKLDEEGNPATDVILLNTPYASLSAEKKWNDESNRNNSRKVVNVTLKTLTADVGTENGTNVVKTDAAGNPLKNPETFGITDGTVTWKKLRVYQQVSVSAIAAFTSEQAKPLVYQVEEASLSGYTTTYASTDADGSYQISGKVRLVNKENKVTVSNALTPEKAAISVQKQWDDSANAYGSRPTAITLTLYYRIDAKDAWTKVGKDTGTTGTEYAAGKVVTTSEPTQTMTGDKTADTWTAASGAGTWENLPTHVLVTNGNTRTSKPVYYRVFEQASEEVPDTIAGTTENTSAIPGYTTAYAKKDGDSFEAESTDAKVQTITNTLSRQSMTASKTWYDDATVAVTRPAEIELELEYRIGDTGNWNVAKNPANPAEDYTVTLKASGADWKSTVTALPVTASNGERYQYRAKELRARYTDTTIGTNGVVEATGSFESTNAKKWVGTVSGYTGTVTIEAKQGSTQDFVTTASNTLAVSSLKVVKYWNDGNNRDGKRPQTIAYQLYRDGKAFGAPVTVGMKADGSAMPGTVISQDNNEWSYTWAKLPKYKTDAAGHTEDQMSEYYVVETLTTPYDSIYTTTYGMAAEDIAQSEASSNVVKLNAQSGVKTIYVENTYRPIRYHIDATKTWVDQNDNYGWRTSSVTMKLQYQLEGDSTWMDVAHVDRAEELDTTGAEVQTTSKVEQIVQKRADDVDENIWTSDGWDDLPAYAKNTAGESKLVTYRVIETAVPANYTVSYGQTYSYRSGDTERVLTITNTSKNDYSFTVQKVWNQETLLAQYGAIPEKVHVHLEYSADGGTTWNRVTKNGEWDLTADPVQASDSRWSHLFTGLNKENRYRAVEDFIAFDVDGSEVQVPVAEGKAGNFDSTSDVDVSDANHGSATITNTSADKKLTISKKWEDENNRDGIRPDKVTVRLFRDGAAIDEVTLDENNSWTYTWDYLPIYKNGAADIIAESAKSVYEIREIDIEDGYEAAYTVGDKAAGDAAKFTLTDADALSVVITNSHTPEKLTIIADKKWEDNNNKFGTRPENIYLSLLYRYEGETDADWRAVNEADETADMMDGRYNDSKVYTTSAVEQSKPGEHATVWSKTICWENLPTKGTEDGVAADSRKIEYKIVETAGLFGNSGSVDEFIPSGYDVSYSGIVNDFRMKTQFVTVTNTLKATSLEVDITWDDQQNQYGRRPDAVKCVLQRRTMQKQADGSVTPTAWEVVNKKNNVTKGAFIFSVEPVDNAWETSVDMLPAYDTLGDEYEYRAVQIAFVYGDKEVEVDDRDNQETEAIETEKGGYNSTSASGRYADMTGIDADRENESYMTKIANKLETIDIDLEIKWTGDEENPDKRPSNVQVTMKDQNGAFTISDILWSKDGNVWTGKIAGLPKYLAGGEIPAEYEVHQVETDGYVLQENDIKVEDGKAAFVNECKKETVVEESETGSADGTTNGAAKTGDKTPLAWLIVVMLASGLSIAVLYGKKKR